MAHKSRLVSFIINPDELEFYQNLKELEDKTMVLKRTNEVIRSRLRKVVAGFERINKYLVKKSVKEPGKPECADASRPPLAKSTRVLLNSYEKQMTDSFSDTYSQRPRLPSTGSLADAGVSNYLLTQNPGLARSGPDRPRSYSESVSVAKRPCKLELKHSFPSDTNHINSYGSEKSIDSIIRFHNTTNYQKSYSRNYNVSKSDSTINSLHYSTISSKFNQRYSINAGGKRPSCKNSSQFQTTLDDLLRSNGGKKIKQSTTPTSTSKPSTNKDAVAQLDSCIQMLMKLGEDF